MMVEIIYNGERTQITLEPDFMKAENMDGAVSIKGLEIEGGTLKIWATDWELGEFIRQLQTIKEGKE